MYKRHPSALETRLLDSACAMSFLSASFGVCIPGATSGSEKWNLFNNNAAYGHFWLKTQGSMVQWTGIFRLFSTIGIDVILKLSSGYIYTSNIFAFPRISFVFPFIMNWRNMTLAEMVHSVCVHKCVRYIWKKEYILKCTKNKQQNIHVLCNFAPVVHD